MDSSHIKICIMGASTITNNRGVSALAVSLVKIFLGIRPDAKLSFITGSRDSSPQKIVFPDRVLMIPTINYRLSPKAPLKEQLLFILALAIVQWCIPIKKIREMLIRSNLVLKNMNEADFIADIQGGDSFSDIYGFNGFIIGIIPMFLALLLRKKLVLLPQTYGPYNNFLAKHLAKLIIKNTFYAFSRDMDGVNQIRKIKSDNTHFSFCPDVAFTLDPVKPHFTQIVPQYYKSNQLVVGLNINGLMYNGGYTRNNMFGLGIDYKQLIIDIILTLLKQNRKVLLIPHTYGEIGNVNSDPIACEEVMNRFENTSVYILKGVYNQSEIKSIIGTCDFFIGSRMHACIAALSQGVPTIGVAYSKKFIGVFDSIGVADMVIDCRNEDLKSIIMKINNVFNEKTSKKPERLRRIEAIQSQIYEKFNLLFENI